MRRPGKFLTLITVAVFCASSAAHSKEADTPASVKSLPPQIEVSYYPVQGESVEELELSIAKNGPLDLTGSRRTAVFDWRLEWNWIKNEAGDVDLKRTSVSARYLLKLPKLVKQPDKEKVSRGWTKYMGAVVKHELNHYANAERCVGELKDMLARLGALADYASKREVMQASRQILKRCSRRDLDYDHKTRNGEREGVDLSES